VALRATILHLQLRFAQRAALQHNCGLQRHNWLIAKSTQAREFRGRHNGRPGNRCVGSESQDHGVVYSATLRSPT
jgi:hypothetical protein